MKLTKQDLRQFILPELYYCTHCNLNTPWYKTNILIHYFDGKYGMDVIKLGHFCNICKNEDNKSYELPPKPVIYGDEDLFTWEDYEND